MKRVAFLLFAGIALAGVTRASAQEVRTASMTASINIPEVLSIGVDNNAVAFPDATAADYDAVTGTGVIAALNTTGITTRGNVVHHIEVKAETELFSYTGPAGTANKAVSDLQWSANGGSWTGLPYTSPLNVVSSLGRGVQSTTVAYQLNTSLTDPPGAYSATFVYTVVAN